VIRKFDPHAIPTRTVADLLERLGGIAPARVIAEPFPGTATEDDVIRLLENPRQKVRAELIDGILVEKPMGFLQSIVAAALITRLMNLVQAQRLGVVSVPDGPFRMESGNIRFPDVAFVPWEVIPEDMSAHAKIADLPFTLAVEILSESNTPKEIAMKLTEYFARGCKLAWIIDPATETATAYTSAKRGKAIPVDGELTGGKVLPGFTLKLSDLFAATKRPAKK
jgi:Uma2 family endonuclease